MDLKRRVRDRICFVLLILGNTATALFGQTLDCTNDYVDTVFCHFDAQNCSEYSLTLQSNDGKMDCIFKECEVAQCCCSFHQMTLVRGETQTATVWRGVKSMESKIIYITDSIKPKPPTITSVKESNGNFHVQWRTNQEGYLGDHLLANVTYYKKGDTEKVSTFIKPSIMNGLNYFEIPGRRLEPSTTYVVSVKSYTSISGKFSESSKEVEFKTPVSSDAVTLAVIISLSLAAVIISAAVFGCFVKLKTKWRDAVAKCPNPKILNMHPSEQELLKPLPPIISSVYVEPLDSDDNISWSKGSVSSSGSPQQSSGISTGSSNLSYAHTEPVDIIAGVQDALGKAFANISPVSALTTNPLNPEFNNNSGLNSSPSDSCGFQPEETSPGSFGFHNKTYFIFNPSCPPPIMTNSTEIQMQAEMLCDSAYQPCAGDTVTCADQQAPACPLVNLPSVVLSVMPTDMSYQQCNAASGGFSSAQDFSVSSNGNNTIAPCDPVSGVEVGLENADGAGSGATQLHGKTEGATVCDESPCHGRVPAGSHSFPEVDGNYQSFQDLVEKPAILFSEERSGEKEDHLSRCPEESFTKMPQSLVRPVVSGFINNNQGSQSFSEPQRHFLPLIPADQSLPIITDSGYQSL